MEGCEYCCDGAADNGLCTEDFLCQEHHWGHPLLPLQQTEQNEEERLHSLQASGFHACQGRFNTHYHYGSSSKGNSRLLQLPCRQPESIPFLDSVHTGRSEVTLLLYISTCLNAVAELRCCLCRGYVVRLDVLFYSSFLFLIVFFLREYILHISQGSRKMLC